MPEPTLAAFDTETTGLDVESDRIVSAAIVTFDANGGIVDRHEWLIDPGIPVPDEAAAVHGITTDHVRMHGITPGAGIGQILTRLYEVTTGYRGDAPAAAALPLVVFNAPYDLTLLDREVRRIMGHGMFEHMDEAEGELVRENWLGPVFDPFVIDKHIDRYRKGSRQLTALAQHFGVEFEGDAHGALADAIAAGRLMQRMPLPADQSPDGREWPVLAMATPAALHDAQIRWKREQAESFAEYLARKGNLEEAEKIDPVWPIRELGIEYEPLDRPWISSSPYA